MAKEILVVDGFETLKISGFDAFKNKVKSELKVYSEKDVDDDESYKSVKKDRAELVKVKNKVDAERKRLSKDLKKDIDSLIALVDEPINIIDKKLGAYEEVLKDIRLTEIYELFEKLESPVEFEKIFENRWLNLSADWKKELISKIEKIKNELNIIKTISDDTELESIYLEVLDIAEAKRIYDMNKQVDNEIEEEIVSEDKETEYGFTEEYEEKMYIQPKDTNVKRILMFYSDDETYKLIKELVSEYVDLK